MVERTVSDDDDDESSVRHLRRESRIRLSEFSLALLFKERRNPPTPPGEVEEEEEDEELDHNSIPWEFTVGLDQQQLLLLLLFFFFFYFSFVFSS